MNSDDEIWTRREGETAKAYAAFCDYRKMPAQHRSLRRMAEDTGRSLGVVMDWNAKWGWRARIEAWDDYCDQLEREEQVAHLKEMGVNRIDLSLEFARAIRLKMVGDEELKIEALDVNKLTAKDIVSMTDALVKLDRLTMEAHGEIEKDKPLEVKLSFELSPSAQTELTAAARRVGTTKKSPPAIEAGGSSGGVEK